MVQSSTAHKFGASFFKYYSDDLLPLQVQSIEPNYDLQREWKFKQIFQVNQKPCLVILYSLVDIENVVHGIILYIWYSYIVFNIKVQWRNMAAAEW